MKSLYNAIEILDPAARIPALRGLANSAMAKAIGSIRQHMRVEARKQRDEENNQGSLDERNFEDENARVGDEIDRLMGFAGSDNPMLHASKLHALYDTAYIDLGKLINRGELRSYDRRNECMSLKGMLEFMTNKATNTDAELVKQVANAIKCDPKLIEQVVEAQNLREKSQMIEATPEIISTFTSFGDNGYDDSFDNLPLLDQHQFGVKTVENLSKAKDRVIENVMRTKKLTELGSIPLIEEGITNITAWVDEFETKYRDELLEAMEAGRNIKTLE